MTTKADKQIQKDINWTPHAGQQEVLDCKNREKVLCAGRRWGKSVLCAYMVIKILLQPGKRVWVVAPSYDLAMKVFEYVVKWLAVMFPDTIGGAVTYRPFPKIRLPNGSILECKSAENPTGLLGEEVDLLIVDEAARISRIVYEQYLYPTTSSRQGDIVFISTPFGENWFFQKFNIAKREKAAFQFESRDNPSFPKGEWERAKGILPQQVFNQEYKASFLPDAAAVFRGVDNIIDDNALADVVKEDSYIMGVDLAKHEDFTVLTVINKTSKKVVHFDRFKQIDYPFQKKRIIALAKRYNNARIVVDSTGIGSPIKEDLERESGIVIDDFVFSNKSKKELVEKLSIFIEQQHVSIPNNNILIDELHSFGYQLTDKGNVVYSAPQGMHDDCVYSLALAVWGLTPGQGKVLSPIQREMLKHHMEQRGSSRKAQL